MTDHAAQRTRRLNLAFGTGLVARAAGAIVQLVSLPIAANTLGDEGFVLFGSALALLNLLMLSHLGIGSSMAIKMGEAWGRDDWAAVSAIYRAGRKITMRLSVVTTACAAFIFFAYPGLGEILPRDMISNASLQMLGLVLLGIYFVAVHLVTHEGAILAFQELDSSYRFQTVGSIVAITTVCLTAWFAPSVTSLLLALWIPQLGARIANVTRFRARHREQLSHLPSSSPSLLGRGMLLLVVMTGVGLACHFVPILLVANRMDEALAANFTAVMNAIVLLISFYALTSSPFRGALPEAIARSDYQWIRKTLTRTLALNGVAGAAFLLLMLLAGDRLFEQWFSGAVSPSKELLVWAAIYFLLFGILDVLRAFLAGFDDISFMGGWAIFMIATVSSVLWLGLPAMSTTAIFITLSGAVFALAIIPFALRAASHLSGHKT